MRLIALLLLIVAIPAFATDWAVQPGSTLRFSTSYDGEKFEGQFKKFSSQIRFNPNNLADNRFDVRIVLASADTQNSERDEMLRSVEFFNTNKMPEARFLATQFRALGNNRYAANGMLSLRGINKPVALTFTWTPGVKPKLVGEAQLKRLDFSVGTGEWADTDLLPNAVKVKTQLFLAPVTTKK